MRVTGNNIWSRNWHSQNSQLRVGQGLMETAMLVITTKSEYPIIPSDKKVKS